MRDDVSSAGNYAQRDVVNEHSNLHVYLQCSVVILLLL
jgi:hypothetical protein